MKIAIMQPYFFPYLGYWQLMNIVDKFVIYDDVNYIKRGWINRNRILVEGKPFYIHVPVVKASQNKIINEMEVFVDSSLRKKELKTIELAYKKAPFFDSVYPLIKDIINTEQNRLSEYLIKSLHVIARYLQIETEFLISSQIRKNNNLKAQDKIIDICRVLEADEYYNAIGGLDLYSGKMFNENGIQLFFVNMNEISYKQYNNSFVPNLSILDIMMFNSVEEIHKMLKEYTLVRK